MDFRTIVEIGKGCFELNPQRPLMLLGSCFSDNIGDRLTSAMWKCAVNPCGVLYNPASIASIVARALDNNFLSDEDIATTDNRYFSWLFDSHFASVDKSAALQKMNDALSMTAEYLNNISCLIVTFGTAWIYELAENRQVVSNCHKFPSNHFLRRKMSVEEIANLWIPLIERLQKNNPELKIIFTVSPIRHFKDGAHENTLSKSTLMLAIDRIISETQHTDYFPAYELVIDELRDYRFYADDMLHPSKVAIDYIWKRFSQKYFSTQTIDLIAKATKLSQRLKHRPLTDNIAQIDKFHSETERLISDFIAAHPFLQKP